MMKKIGIFAFVILLLTISLIPMISSQTTSPSTSTQTMCDTFFTPNINSNSFNIQSSSIISISILLVFMMLGIVAIIYAIGYSFGIGKFVNFARGEIGEAIISIILILIIVSGTSILSFAFGGVAASGQSPSSALFAKDCNYLLTASLSQVPQVIISSVITQNYVIGTFTNFRINLIENDLGFSVQPFAGMGLLSGIIGDIVAFTTGLIFLMLSVIFFLGIVFYVFPFFLYLGIVLRAFPWTRIIGGSLIALFIGFYLVLPLMLSITTGTLQQISASSIPNTVTSVLPGSSQNSCPTVNTLASFYSCLLYSNFISYIWSNVKVIFSVVLGDGLAPISFFITNTLAGMLYIILSFIISFIISIEITDELSDLLGAPSLNSVSVLQKVI